MRERERLASEEKHAERLYELKACELDQRAVELEEAERETRSGINAATRDYNLALVHTQAQHYILYTLTVCISKDPTTLPF